MTDPRAMFSPPVKRWFSSTFCEATPAPTGTGKTLSAFLWAFDRVGIESILEDPVARTRVVYRSPLRALAVDIEKSLWAPLQGSGSRRNGTRSIVGDGGSAGS